MRKDENVVYILFHRENFFQCYSIKSWKTKILKDHIVGVDKMIQSLDKSFQRIFEVSDKTTIQSDLLSIRFPPSSIPFNYLKTFEIREEFAARFFGKRGEILHFFFLTTFTTLGRRVKGKIRCDSFSKGEFFEEKFYFPSRLKENRPDRSSVYHATSRSPWNLEIHGHGCESRENFVQGSAAPLFSLLSFFLAVFFLTFWNRHGAERGSLTKVGNHTHRFHAMPVRPARLQGGRVGRAPVHSRSSFPRKLKKTRVSQEDADGTGQIFLFLPIMTEQFLAEQRSIQRHTFLLLLHKVAGVVFRVLERSLKANGVSSSSDFRQAIVPTNRDSRIFRIEIHF